MPPLVRPTSPRQRLRRQAMHQLAEGCATSETGQAERGHGEEPPPAEHQRHRHRHHTEYRWPDQPLEHDFARSLPPRERRSGRHQEQQSEAKRAAE